MNYYQLSPTMSVCQIAGRSFDGKRATLCCVSVRIFAMKTEQDNARGRSRSDWERQF